MTDDHGEVIVRWFPRDTTYVDVHVQHPEWKVDEIEVDKNGNRLTVVHVRHKVRVAGRLQMPAGQSAEGILVNSFGFGPKQRGDIPTARAAADGSFSFLATWDHGYALQIADSQWASDGWTGLILAEENSMPADISMEVYPAIPVEVHVARGPEHTPVANAWIATQMTGTFTWQNAKGEKKNASSGAHSYWLRTDESGVARVAAAKGTLEVRLSAGEWGEEKEIKVDGKEPAVVEFYRPWASQRKIIGRLTLNDAPYQQSPTATILAATNHKQYVPEPLKASLHEDGSFEIEGDTANLSVLITDADKRIKRLRPRRTGRHGNQLADGSDGHVQRRAGESPGGTTREHSIALANPGHQSTGHRRNRDRRHGGLSLRYNRGGRDYYAASQTSRPRKARLRGYPDSPLRRGRKARRQDRSRRPAQQRGTWGELNAASPVSGGGAKKTIASCPLARAAWFG